MRVLIGRFPIKMGNDGPFEGDGHDVPRVPRVPGAPVSVGQDDKEPGIEPASPGGGMIVGPEHPIFDYPYGQQTPPSVLPRGAVPPGARFDPITPVGPSRGPHGDILYPSGEPDSDELPPPGGPNPVDPGWRPPRPGTFKGPFRGGFGPGGHGRFM